MSDYASLRTGNLGSRGRGFGAGPGSGGRGGRRGSAGSGRPAERAFIVLLAVAALGALVIAAILVLPSVMRITRYEVSGNLRLSRDEILSAALIHDKEYFLSLDPSRVKAALEAQPRIAEAEVSKLFPDGLKIAVRERVPVAAAMATIGGRPAAVCLDSEGMAFAEATGEEAASVPIISGIRIEGFRPGTRLPGFVAELLASMGEIAAKEPALLAAVSEIRIVAPASAASQGGEASPGGDPALVPELLIYPLHYRIPVRAGASLDASTLRSMILVLDVLGTKGIADTVRELDLRSGRAVYSTKEGQAG